MWSINGEVLLHWGKLMTFFLIHIMNNQERMLKPLIHKYYEKHFILRAYITYNRQLLLVMIGKLLAERLIQRRICELHLIITSCVVLIILVSKMAQRDILLLTTIL